MYGFPVLYILIAYFYMVFIINVVPFNRVRLFCKLGSLRLLIEITQKSVYIMSGEAVRAFRLVILVIIRVIVCQRIQKRTIAVICSQCRPVMVGAVVYIFVLMLFQSSVSIYRTNSFRHICIYIVYSFLLAVLNA